ncbi:MAG: class I SAM-dependent methyltransferase family protein [Candidatus Lokiarchaeota archaeon]|nr:class I SAM-dependent methyltransferase family protein [Candidatus Lokiarchaeota archaeon]
MGFKDKLKEHLKGKFSEEQLSLLPRGFQTLGKIIILKLNPKLYEKKKEIGGACLELFPKIKSIYLNRGRIIGSFREPEKIELIVGENNPIVEHKEHDVIYRFDITKIMFSKGNLYERKYLTTLVKSGEVIVDMFAGMGYFSLPIAKHSTVERIYSIELNPESYKCLEENIKLNHLEQKIVPIKGDCKVEVVKLSKSGIRADRIIMGVFPAPKDYIKEALSLVKDEGTMFHYEGVIEKDDFIILFNEFNEISIKVGYKCELKSHRTVKSYGPNLFHVVLDIFVFKI